MLGHRYPACVSNASLRLSLLQDKDAIPYPITSISSTIALGKAGEDTCVDAMRAARGCAEGFTENMFWDV